MPLFPATIFSQAVSTLLPTGDTMPNPVITTRRLLKTHLYWNGKRNRLRHTVAADCAVAVAPQAAAHEKLWRLLCGRRSAAFAALVFPKPRVWGTPYSRSSPVITGGSADQSPQGSQSGLEHGSFLVGPKAWTLRSTHGKNYSPRCFLT